MKFRFAIFLLLGLAEPLLAVKTHDFKTCSKSAFCRRGRDRSERSFQAGDTWHSPYSLDLSTVSYSPSKSSFKAAVKSELYPKIKFELDVRIHKDGVARIRMDEIKGLRQRYNEAASWALIAEPELMEKDVNWTEVGKGGEIRTSYGSGIELRIVAAPLKISLLRNGKEEIVLNGRGLLHMEHFRTKESSEETEARDSQVVLEDSVRNSAWFEGEEEDGYWEESFLTWTDSKPKGPESLTLDITFPVHAHVYGLPEHASPLSLPTTVGPSSYYQDPYRLYNLDVYEYLADSPMSLYGNIPLLHAHSERSTVGIFNAIASETWVDIHHPSPESTSSHWISESGILDVFLLPGPTPADVFKQYAGLTGPPVLPALWALGYHQCRWNYVSSDDVRFVQSRFDEEDMPLDVLWLDIEYSEEHKYFIWDKKNFPDPVDMVNDVAAIGRKMVVIIDPHLKRTSSYPVYASAQEHDVLVKKAGGNDEYEGWCWSGSSAWVDFSNPRSWDWWKSLFRLDGGGNSKKDKESWSWKESTESVFIWNDMNEPAVFSGPEMTMPKDNIHYGGWEHRDIHNANGMLFQNQTSQAVSARSSPAKRPFVLSRSFWAGSQRFGAIWTGDNMGTWEHMAVGLPMVLSNGIAGMTFSGADVGGFFGNPDPEMLVRWYQVGAFAPFFRGHAHIDTKRREPYLLDEPYKSIVRDILKLRYSLLPVWYTAFREASVDGIPVLRPQYVVFPKDKKGFAIDNQYYIGASGLLVRPVVAPGVTETEVYLAEDQVYYDYFTYDVYRGSSSGKNVTVPSPLDKFPLLLRGESILPVRLRPRRSSSLMRVDPFTLILAMGKSGNSRGELYLDDGETYSHKSGEIVWREFKAKKDGKKGFRLTSEDLVRQADGKDVVDGVALQKYNVANPFARSMENVRIERIVVLGLDAKPKAVKVEKGSTEEPLEWSFEEGVGMKGKKEGKGSVLVIKSPKLQVVKDWSVFVEF